MIQMNKTIQPLWSNTMRQQIIDNLKSKDFDEKHIIAILSHFDSEKANGCSDDEALSSVIKRFFKPKSQEAKANTIDYQRALELELRKPSCGLNGGQIKAIMEKFTTTANRYGAERAFSIIHEAYANGSTDDAKVIHEAYGAQLNVAVSTPMSREIQSELSRISSDNKILTNPVERTKRAISNIHANYARLMRGLNASLLSSFTKGQELLLFDQQDYEQVMDTVPKLHSEKIAEYQAFGSWKKTNTLSSLELE
jgi:hypothetical protein